MSKLENAFSTVAREYFRLTTGDSDDSEEYPPVEDLAQRWQNPIQFLETAEAALEKYKDSAADDDLERLRESIQETRALLENSVFHSHGLVARSPRLLAFLTHMFLHGGFTHLISNLIFLILVGPSLEDLWGRTVFAFTYLFSGIAAAIGYTAVNFSSPVPMIGASGAIAGLMGAFLMTFTHTRINILGAVFVPGMFRVFTFYTPAWVFLPVWIGMEILQGLLQLGLGNVNTGGVAHWAHIAGFFFGLAVPWGLQIAGLDRKLFPVFAKDKENKEILVSFAMDDYLRSPDYRKGVRLQKEGDLAGAETCFKTLAEQHPKCLGLRLEMVDLYRAIADEAKIRENLLQALDLAVKGEDPRMISVYETMRREFPREESAPEVLLRVGTAFERAGKPVDALECLQKFVKAAPPEHPLWVRGSLRLANLLSGPMKNPAAARDLLLKAREAATDQAWKNKVERQLKALEANLAGASASPSQSGKQVDRVGG
ncbi:MAG: rhomboid family intramembrane serine protease [Planctomycetes bacterium]|nr:rhomboid family intramembrane serine protease [Planctomycetota bacterium]